MFKNIKNKTLLLVLGVTLLVLGVSRFFSSKNGESTFKAETITIDTAAITEVYIYNKADNYEEVKLQKKGTDWVASKGSFSVSTEKNAVKNFMSALLETKLSRLAAKNKDKWVDFQVDDTSGTHIRVVEGEKTALDIVVGKFVFQQQRRSGLTYVRLANETEVYAVDGFLAMSVSQGFDSWRNKAVVKSNKEDWTTLTFTYPDSSFVLFRSDRGWMVNGNLTDSSKTQSYFGQLATLSHYGAFENSFDPSGKTPIFKLTVSGNNMGIPVELQAFEGSDDRPYVIISSQNPKTYFVSTKEDLVSKIFIGENELF